MSSVNCDDNPHALLLYFFEFIKKNLHFPLGELSRMTSVIVLVTWVRENHIFSHNSDSLNQGALGSHLQKTECEHFRLCDGICSLSQLLSFAILTPKQEQSICK